ncbi:hypothetical protein [Texcoconibacillus texcoconensis]|uniref:Uncharacterized membrane protein HdeD (DUF308 family) n=1 Tax=Texcoconibacillus texcoconensis TaxID=1095777 RepID=A0A840QPP9_9BACI|nr:hypothetical protein [Texcoconibacillus texcoconensis]MBB5173297.1 uncharacterized membrane protein HdeD (DUF308 family) [Texcoconibacillus texcoconensis]
MNPRIRFINIILFLSLTFGIISSIFTLEEFRSSDFSTMASSLSTTLIFFGIAAILYGILEIIEKLQSIQ